MKVIKTLFIGSSLLLVTLTLGLFVLSTSFDVEPVERSDYTAILMSRTELEKSIAYQSPKAIEQVGKIYKKDSWILITEKYKGIHIIDNTTPATPVNAGFIRIPGCVDISMKNNSLYADNSVDLVTLDMSSIPQIKVTSRLKNVFPELLPPDLEYIPSKFSQENRPANTVIVEWQKVK
jgi:hypothetical protein